MSDSEHERTSDVDMDNEDLDGEPEVEDERRVDDSDGVDEGAEEEDKESEEDEDALEEASEGESTAPSPPPAPLRFKLTLKLPPRSASNTVSTPTPAPDDVSHPASRRGLSQDLDVESEDEEDFDPDPDHISAPPILVPTGRSMTTRQAVLSNFVDSTHVSLSEISRKKKPLNDAELALRREETARKRKNLSEKKLEDEKAETINRLLKKQSRSKNKRNVLATADDPTAATTPSTTKSANLLAPPTTSTATPAPDDPDAEDVDGRESALGGPPSLPEMYRWVSSVRGGGEEKKMVLSYSVPVCVLNSYPAGVMNVAASGEENIGQDNAMVLDTNESPQEKHLGHPLRVQYPCDMFGCTQPRKYRMVKDWTRGACGMGHLKELEAAGASASVIV
jgi:Ino eighty subunit 2